jgi:hypothetical protein
MASEGWCCVPRQRTGLSGLTLRPQARHTLRPTPTETQPPPLKPMHGHRKRPTHSHRPNKHTANPEPAHANNATQCQGRNTARATHKVSYQSKPLPTPGQRYNATKPQQAAHSPCRSKKLRAESEIVYFWAMKKCKTVGGKCGTGHSRRPL